MLTQQVTSIMAMTAGMVSFLSPCVLPLIPGYVSFISGVPVANMAGGRYRPTLFDRQHWAVMLNALLFVLGFSSVFILLGASATWLGSLAYNHLSILTKISGGLILFFGLVKLGIFKFGFFLKDMRFHLDANRKGTLFSLVLGMAFAFGWTPCTGPVLGAILTYAGTVEQVNSGIRLLLFYSAGLGIPFLLTALFIQYFFKIFSRIKPWLRHIEKATGLILVIMGVLIFTDSLSTLAVWLPALNRFTL